MNPLTEIAQDITGAAALADWLGDNGVPVDPMVAELRAQRCVIGNKGEPCPHNKEPNWWGRIKSTIADWIRKEIEVKNGMGLHVESEDSLHMCAKCGCALPLKVWVPRKHLEDHTDKTKLKDWPSWCWLRREMES